MSETDLPSQPSPENDKGWFELTWNYREDVLYKELFGSSADEIYTIPETVFTKIYQQESVDPRWLHTGVIVFPPNPERDTWAYVTSGLSNEWWATEPDPTQESGLGCEFVMEIRPPHQGPWAIKCLLDLSAYQILCRLDLLPDRSEMIPYHSFPLGCPVNGQGGSTLTSLLVCPSHDLPETSHLDSGYFQWYRVTGITEAEAAYARSGHSNELIRLLINKADYPKLDASRSSVV